jgi:6-phosphogluconolactonase
LVAVNEIGNYNGEKAGSVSSFKIDRSSGSLSKLNQVSSGGGSPCYVSLNKSGSLALVSNYSGGNVSVIPINADGTLSKLSDLKQHSGNSVDEKRQKAPFAHSVVISPKGDYALAVDLGIDKVISYEINSKKGLLSESSQFSLNPGSGPRHLTFHPNKKLAFIISELNSTVTSCTFDSNDAVLTEVMSVSTLPQGYNDKSYCADVHVSPDGKYLYGSNRGHDSIVIFKIDQKTGELSFIDHQSVKGKWPRNFMIDPTGKFLLVANQHTNNIVVFKIDQETGKLKSNGVEVEVAKPVCLKMIPVE